MTLPEVIATANALKAELDALRPMPPDAEQRVWQKLRLDWNFHSNNIEGNSLDYGETEILLLHGKAVGDKLYKDYEDIKGHNEAIMYLQDLVSRSAMLTEVHIREFHKLILSTPRQIDAETPDGQPTKRWIKIGEYKTMPNHVRTATGEMFRYVEPFDTPAEMHNLMSWYHQSFVDESIHPLLLAATFHYKFIRIHPFDDGNGRIVRILMNLALMMKGLPPAIIKTDDRNNYYTALQRADGGDLESFVVYIGKQLVRSLELMLKAARGEEIEEPDDVDKQIFLLKAKIKATQATIKRSPEITSTLLSMSIFPILEKMIKKLSKFDELFVEKSFVLTTRYYEARPILFKDRIPTPDKYDALASDLSFIELDYTWSEFLHHPDNHFDCSVSFSVQFDDFKYIINGMPNSYSKQREKFYYQTIDEKEQNEIVNEVVIPVMNDLKEKSER
ncbi:MAG: Fic family protein [Rhizobacter sp.]|nr:Fic family protein [Chlorobiales bacterium]